MRLLAITCLFMGVLWAGNLTNSGLKQNDLGYYGEEANFGNVSIVGSWNFCEGAKASFDLNGTVNFGTTRNYMYGLSEDAIGLLIDVWHGQYLYTVKGQGNMGCLEVEYFYHNYDVHIPTSGTCIICKTSTGSKTYGPNSNRVNITVGAE